MPAANHDYWNGKIGRNVERDQRTQQKLRELGWEFHIIWECELAAGIEAVIAELENRRSAQERTRSR
jgi:DNA mismatch endonuclease (patch repair protein)